MVTKRNKYNNRDGKCMTLYLIGLGLNDEKDITLKGLEIVRRAKRVWLESYTAILHCKKEGLEKAYGRGIELADRETVEKNAGLILEPAVENDVAFLVAGDPMSATTHIDLMLRAKNQGVRVEIVHNASVLTAVGVVGLDLYKYGRTTTIVFPSEGLVVESFYDVVKENKARGLHTLCLVDIKTNEPTRAELMKESPRKYEKPRFMTVNEAIESLLAVESRRKEGVFTPETLCVGCARLGSPDTTIKAGKASEMLSFNFGAPLHCLVVPGKLHFVEEEALTLWKQ